MEHFFQILSLIIISVIATVIVGYQRKEMELLITLGACAMALIAAVEFLKPVTEFIQRLIVQSDIDTKMVGTILKATMIGLVGELAKLICTDAGGSSLGKTIEMISHFAILWLSIPLMEAFLELIGEVLASL